MKTRDDIRNSVKIYGFTGIILLFILTILSYFFNRAASPQPIVKKVTTKIVLRQNEMINELKSLKQDLNLFRPSDLFLSEKNLIKYKSTEQAIIVYDSGKLVAWSDNNFPAPQTLDSLFLKEKMIFYGNGYYLIETEKAGDVVLINALLVKHKYKYHNESLKPEFSSLLNIPSGIELSLTKGKYCISDKDNKFLFTLIFQKAPPISGIKAFILLLLLVLSLLFITTTLFYIYFLFANIFWSKHHFLWLFVIDVILVRAVQFYLKLPSALYSTDLFSPFYYASSFLLPSLGDLIINGFLLVQIAYFTFKNTSNLEIHFIKKRYLTSAIWVLVFSILTSALYISIAYLLEKIVRDSNIPFNFDYILNFSLESFYVILAISLFVAAFILFFQTLIRLILKETKPIIIFTYYILTICIIICYHILSGKNDFAELLVVMLLIAIQMFYNFRVPDISIHVKLLTGVVIISGLVTFIITEINLEREHEQRRILANHLSESRDLMLEYNFGSIQNEINKDPGLQKILSMKLQDSLYKSLLENYLKNEYFKGFWNKYNLQITLCNSQDNLYISANNYTTACNTYFENQIMQTLEPSPVNDLYYLKQTGNSIYYLGRIQLMNINTTELISVFVEITSSLNAEGPGYPQLLMDNSIPSYDHISEYSYCYYIDNEIVKRSGKYFYKTRQIFDTINEDDHFYNENGFEHLQHKVDNRTILLLSRPQLNFIELVSPFAYIVFTISLILVIIFVITGRLRMLALRLRSYAVRLQFFIIAIILISTLIIGVFTLFFITNQNKKSNQNLLNEKMNSVLVELENNLKEKTQITGAEQVELNTILLNLANSNFTDVNLFSLDGKLIGTSRQQIFEEKLISTQMDPEVLVQLAKQHKSFYIHYEKIGKDKFLSAYAPVRNIDNKLLGYINLPYFARQEEIRRDVSKLLATFSNLYILMAVLALIVALFLARYVTGPLKLIRTQLGKFSLGQSNAKVKWQGTDEIGGLVAEYNRMIDELAVSAEKLAKSEREHAWRQMARQVAHEIKNPLTPIKLSMQLLLKAWDDKTPDWESRLKRFSETLIMQIDTLSAIATEFSDFAQMPEPVISRFNIIPVLQYAVGLFKDAPNVIVNMESDSAQYIIKADEKQMLRVFNNLIKNAIQAMPPDREGVIDISVKKNEGGKIKIQFRDNGTGIPAEQQTRIFSPNFTTKSAGMGLGLAMVKNIVEIAGGRIWFDSVQGSGTTFFVLLPIDSND